MPCVGVGDEKSRFQRGQKSFRPGDTRARTRTFDRENDRFERQKNKFREKIREGKRQNNVWGPPWTPTRISSRPLRVFGRRMTRWMRHRRLDVPVQKDGEASERNEKKKMPPPGIEPGSIAWEAISLPLAQEGACMGIESQPLREKFFSPTSTRLDRRIMTAAVILKVHQAVRHTRVL